MWPLELLLLVYFGYVVFYTLIFSVAGLFYKTPDFAKATTGKPALAPDSAEAPSDKKAPAGKSDSAPDSAKASSGKPSEGYNKFRIFIPSYKEDSVILDSARKALEQSYPATHYKVAVIADSLQPATLVALRQLPIELVEVNFENSTKVKSLNGALTSLPEDVGYAVILDADNLMAGDFFVKNNSVFFPTVRAVKRRRKPKNKNNTLT